MDFALSPKGVLVHARPDWPCAVCRPGASAKRRAYCLCFECATAIVAEASAGAADAQALSPVIVEALTLLKASRARELKAPD